MPSEHTPTPWRIRNHPGAETQPEFYAEEFHISAQMTEDHPYFQSTREIEVMSDEKYPRRRADGKRIVAAVNAVDNLNLSNKFLESGGLLRMMRALEYSIIHAGDLKSHYLAVDVFKEIKIAN